MSFEHKQFKELTSFEVYEILKLRHDVFVIEQQCIYPELDGLDKHCWHVFLFENGNCIATSRIVPPNIKHQKQASIGRVCTAYTYRKTGIGKMLMQYSIEQTKKLYPNTEIVIGAQLYLKKFYESFGFVQISEPYNEDNIMHINMLLKASI